MRNRFSPLLPAVLGVFGILPTLLPTPSQACSVKRIRSAAEITADAEQIVRVEAVKQLPAAADRARNEVMFKVLEVLKGRLPDGSTTLTLPGQTNQYDGPNDAKPPYDFVRPGGRHGNCHAGDYKLGRQFLLFLKSGTTSWTPLSATNEEVSGADDPWVLWVRQRLGGGKK